MTDAATPKQRPFRLKSVKIPESVEQSQVARWLDFRGHLFTHVANGEQRTGRTGAKLKRMGLRPGVPDLLIFDKPQSPAHMHVRGVAIEMKSRYGVLSESQKRWHKRLVDAGWLVNVCRTSTDAIQWLQWLGY